MPNQKIEIDGTPYDLVVAQDSGGQFVGDIVIVPMGDSGRVSVQYPDGFTALPTYSVRLETRIDMKNAHGIDAVKHMLELAENDLRHWAEKGWLRATTLSGPA